MRGIGGAAIVGIPLVYTMEMWQLATLLRPRTVLVLALLAMVVNIGYNYVSGFREDSGFRPRTAFLAADCRCCHTAHRYRL